MPKPRSRKEAIEMLAEYISLTPEAIEIAEGWSLLDKRAKRHVKILIDDHIANLIPVLRPLYENSSNAAQLKFNRVIERIQDQKRGIPPEET